MSETMPYWILLGIITLFLVPVFPAHALATIDGNAQSSGCSNNHADAILTTVHANDIIVVNYFVASANPTVTARDSAGLTWSQRAKVLDGVSGASIFEYTAVSVNVLTADNVSFSNNGVANCNTTAYGVTGQNPSNGYDPSMPATNSGTSGTGHLLNVTASIATSPVLVIAYGHNQGSCSAGAGFTLVRATSGFCSEYGIFDPAGSIFVSIPTAAGTEWQILADGILTGNNPKVSVLAGAFAFASFAGVMTVAGTYKFLVLDKKEPAKAVQLSFMLGLMVFLLALFGVIVNA